jgi:predicted deacylase
MIVAMLIRFRGFGICVGVSDSPISCTIDLEAHGKQYGALRLPRSSNTAGWASTVVPIVVVAGGEGPTALVLGGVHGDEPEGQVAALNLARELRPEHVHGRVIVIPCVSQEASRAVTRLWPSGANMNRSFPGSPHGTPDEQLAHYLSTVLFPLTDVVVDMHSGCRSMLFLPWAEMHWVDDVEQRRRMADAMFAWNTDWCCVYIDIAGSGLLVGEAESQGKVVIGTDLGGGGHVTAAIHRLRRASNVLRRGAFEERSRGPGRAAPTLLMATERTTTSSRPSRVSSARRPRPGGRRGRARRPHPLRAAGSEPGVIGHGTAGRCVVRAIATTDQGDNVVVTARVAAGRSSTDVQPTVGRDVADVRHLDVERPRDAPSDRGDGRGGLRPRRLPRVSAPGTTAAPR